MLEREEKMSPTERITLHHLFHVCSVVKPLSKQTEPWKLKRITTINNESIICLEMGDGDYYGVLESEQSDNVCRIMKCTCCDDVSMIPLLSKHKDAEFLLKNCNITELKHNAPWLSMMIFFRNESWWTRLKNRIFTT